MSEDTKVDPIAIAAKSAELLQSAYDDIFAVIDAIPKNSPPDTRLHEISSVLTQICTLLDPGEEGPVLDRVQSHFALTNQQRFEYAKILNTERTRQNGAAKPKRKKKREDLPGAEYVAFVKQLPHFHEIRRELLSDELMVLMSDGEWRNLLNRPQQKYIESHARDSKKDFVFAAFEAHLENYRVSELPPRLLLDVPEWDNQDRVLEIARKTVWRNISPETFYELILEFGANMFRRIDDESLQPVTPIFQGAQGIGKDSLIDALTAGLGRYRKHLVLSARTEEAEQQLHTALLFVIGEFDHASRADVASLKHMLTVPETDCRLKYDARAQKRRVRASFIASCNVPDIFRDHTGNRRYQLFQADYLGFSAGQREPDYCYPGLWSDPECSANRLQIIAQYKAFAARKFRASAKAHREMGDIVVASTPDDPNSAILEAWDIALGLLVESPVGTHANGKKYYSLQQVQPVLDSLRARFQKPQQALLHVLQVGNRRYRTTNGRFYVAGDLYEENYCPDDKMLEF